MKGNGTEPKALTEAQGRFLMRIATLMREGFSGDIGFALQDGHLRNFEERRRWRSDQLEPPDRTVTRLGSS